jgi:YHS domain-containing protein
MNQNATCPVCGMNINPEKAVKSENGGKTQYFCSNGCKQKFEQGARRSNPREKASTQHA